MWQDVLLLRSELSPNAAAGEGSGEMRVANVKSAELIMRREEVQSLVAGFCSSAASSAS